MTNEMIVKEIDATSVKTPAIVDAIDHYNTMVEYVQKVMKTGVDYGTVPGSIKPSLLKPGAEKLAMLFRLTAEFPLMEKIEDWQAGFFYYRYKCQIKKEGVILAECEGSTNSKEKKYRYRYAFANELSDEEMAKAKRIEKISKKTGKPYFSYQVENTETYDIVNTLQKMAQKRAFVGAVLIAANASEFFTQDIEDLAQVIESEADIVDAQFAEPAKAVVTPNEWGTQYGKALVSAKIVDNEPHAMNMLKLSNLIPGCDVNQVLKWAEIYKKFRDEGCETQDAATKANTFFKKV